MRILLNENTSSIVKNFVAVMRQNGITPSMILEGFQNQVPVDIEQTQLELPSFDELQSKISMSREDYNKLIESIETLGRFDYSNLESFYAEHTVEYYKFVKQNSAGFLWM